MPYCCPGRWPAADEPADKASAVDLGSRWELFVDDWLIDSRQGRVARAATTRSGREVVLVTDAPWEGVTSAYFSVVQDGDLVRLYYRGSVPGSDALGRSGHLRGRKSRRRPLHASQAGADRGRRLGREQRRLEGHRVAQLRAVSSIRIPTASPTSATRRWPASKRPARTGRKGRPRADCSRLPRPTAFTGTRLQQGSGDDQGGVRFAESGVLGCRRAGSTPAIAASSPTACARFKVRTRPTFCTGATACRIAMPRACRCEHFYTNATRALSRARSICCCRFPSGSCPIARRSRRTPRRASPTRCSCRAATA